MLDLTHSKAGRQHDKAAARLEVVDDVGIGSKIQTVVNRGTEQKQDKENDKLWNRHCCSYHAKRAGKYNCGEQIQNRLCNQDAVVCGHTCDNGAVNSGSARAEQRDAGY